MNEMSEGAVLVGVGKPEMKINKGPELKVPPVVEPATVSTPEQLVDEVVKSSTKKQIFDLLHGYIQNFKNYYATIGKVAIGSVVPEVVTTIKGAKELKGEKMVKGPKGETTSEEKIHLNVEGQATSVDQHVVTPEAVLDIKTKISAADPGPGQVLDRTTIETPIADAKKTDVPKKGLLDTVMEAHKKGKKYEFQTELKNKKRENALDAIEEYVVEGLVHPFPDVPKVIQLGAKVGETYFSDKGIQFIPAFIETLVAGYRVHKTNFDISKQLWGVIKDSPEARGAKNNVEAAYRVVRTLLKKDIDQMKTPEVQQAAAVFA